MKSAAIYHNNGLRQTQIMLRFNCEVGGVFSC